MSDEGDEGVGYESGKKWTDRDHIRNGRRIRLNGQTTKGVRKRKVPLFLMFMPKCCVLRLSVTILFHQLAVDLEAATPPCTIIHLSPCFSAPVQLIYLLSPQTTPRILPPSLYSFTLLKSSSQALPIFLDLLHVPSSQAFLWLFNPQWSSFPPNSFDL